MGHKVCSKSIETEAVFTKTERNNDEMSILFNLVPLTFNTLIPVTLLQVKAPLKLFFWYETAPMYFFHYPPGLQISSRDKQHCDRSGEYGGCCTCS